jgi:hypothetical protein
MGGINEYHSSDHFGRRRTLLECWISNGKAEEVGIKQNEGIPAGVKLAHSALK